MIRNHNNKKNHEAFRLMCIVTTSIEITTNIEMTISIVIENAFQNQRLIIITIEIKPTNRITSIEYSI